MKMYIKSAVIISCLLLAGCKEATVSNSDVVGPSSQPAIEHHSHADLQEVNPAIPQSEADREVENNTTDPKALPEEPKKDMRGIIDVRGVMLSAADCMLDFRYRVIDLEKASYVLSKKHKPYLIDQATGAKLLMPESTKIGPLRQTTLKPQKDRTYYVMFANPGRFIKRDSKVDVVIGDFIVRDIVVK